MIQSEDIKQNIFTSKCFSGKIPSSKSSLKSYNESWIFIICIRSRLLIEAAFLINWLARLTSNIFALLKKIPQFLRYVSKLNTEGLPQLRLWAWIALPSIYFSAKDMLINLRYFIPKNPKINPIYSKELDFLRYWTSFSLMEKSTILVFANSEYKNHYLHLGMWLW